MRIESRPCMWKGCNKETKVDVSLERSRFGTSWGITISGWCVLHAEAYRIYHEMERERFGYVTAKVYRENRKEIDRMYKQAERFAESQVRRS